MSDKFKAQRTRVRANAPTTWNNHATGEDGIRLDVACDLKSVYPLSDTQEERIARREAFKDARSRFNKQKRAALRTVKNSVTRDIMAFNGNWEERARADMAASRARRGIR